MSVLFKTWSESELNWLPERGMGYLDPGELQVSYEGDYFHKYLGYKHTDLGRKITDFRVTLTRQHWSGEVVDIGIGCGHFIEEHGCARGFDVNPVAVQWLKERGLYLDVYTNQGLFRQVDTPVLTFWDSLEHIPDPEQMISFAEKMVLLSIPIFKDGEDVLCSKHYRPGEHIWYWTHRGLIGWMRELGFDWIDVSNLETAFGREGIRTYVFRRRQ